MKRIFRCLTIAFLLIALATTSLLYACDSAPEKRVGNASDGVFTFTPKVNGSKADVSVVLSKNPGYSTLILTLDYDSSVLTFTGYDEGTALSSLGLTPTNPNTELGYSYEPFNFVYGTQTLNDTSTGTVLTLHFTIKKGAEKGTTFVGFKYQVNKNEKGQIASTGVYHSALTAQGVQNTYYSPEIRYAAVEVS